MAKLRCNGLKLEVEEYGKPSDPPVLLIMGLAAQLTRWPDAFIQSLLQQRFRVIAFDNRDIGLSEKMTSQRASSPLLVALLGKLGVAELLAPYKLTDMASDAIGVLDALHIERAHVVGASMGGMIGQILCADHPHRISSFTALMSSTNNPALPKAHPRLSWQVMTARPRSGSRDQLIDTSLRVWTLIGTTDSGRDPLEFRREVAAAIDRNYSPAGIRRQMAAIIASGDLRAWTRKISVPGLVVHGADDPLVPLANGLDIAANIKHARMAVIEGMGHDLPPKFLQVVVDHVLSHLRSAEQGTTMTGAANQAA